jgi:hypothetical protein
MLFGFIAILCIPFVRDLHRLPGTPDPDGLQHLSFAYSFYDAVWNHGELPLWNPYFGGGVRWAGYIYNPGISPWGLVYALSGDVVGLKLCLVFTLLLGGLSVYGVARSFLLLPPAFALFAALLYLSSLWMAGRLESGNYNEFSAYFWPLALLSFHGLMRGRWMALLLPMFFVIALNPAKYASLTTLFAGFVILLFGRVYRDQRAFAAGIWLIGALFGFLWAMPKLLPLQDLLKLNLVGTDVQKASGYHGIGEIISIIAGTSQQSHHSFGVGPLGLLLAMVGVVLGWRGAREWVILLAVSAFISMGPNAPYPLSSVLSQVPMGDFGKYFNVFIVTSICLLAAVGLHRLYMTSNKIFSAKRMAAAITFSALSVTTLAFPLWSTVDYFNQAFRIEEPDFDRELFYHVAFRPLVGKIHKYRQPPAFPYANQYHNVRKGIGTITWYGNFVFRESAVPKIFVENDGALQPNQQYRGEAIFVGEAAPTGSVDSLEVSYNSIRFRYRSVAPQRVVLNFNFDANWISDVGRVVDHAGLLAVDLDPSAERDVVLSFKDQSFTIGLWIAVIAMPLYVAIVLQLRRRARRRW